MWVPYDKLRHEAASHYCERQRSKFDDLPENVAKHFAQRRELVGRADGRALYSVYCRHPVTLPSPPLRGGEGSIFYD
jgi:hypothetical protein